MSESPNAPVPARRWPRVLVLGGAMAAGIALGAGGLAAAAVMGGGGWHHGPRLERIQNFVRMSLDSVAATSEQEAKVHDIIAAAYTDLAPKPEDRAAFRKQAVDLLRAPTIDKAAVEKLRSDFVARTDAKSKRFVEAVLSVADVLTPEQRAKLADRADLWAQRGPMMGGHRGHHDGHGRPRRPDDGGQDGDNDDN
ncbi:Spy/CpxP family protein refolding chaperone [Labrys sp. LIt4]|uniref:Spy/CpxP family protein refolding chaperone n=1 Tax=Labrys sp. LIt4 TaxID=2821355 RepID=UPI001AE045CE|nr:Spy/CpxP family protein refolding chaperone [Labrys sp. LIt4]MBP0581704.1 Spy/CpxP family protein refolding chaperone [Labrys sp. LIt4]